MARVESIIPLRGTIGNMTFYKLRGKYYAKRKGGPDPEKIKNDPAYARQRQHMAEFGRAGMAGRMIRTALIEYEGRPSDYSITTRLTSALMEVVKSDPINDRGARTVLNGKVSLLRGFSFNEKHSLRSLLWANPHTRIDPSAGLMEINMPTYAPKQAIKAPGSATHYRIVAIALELDIENDQHQIAVQSTPVLSLTADNVDAFSLITKGSYKKGNVLLLMGGIEFLRREAGGIFVQYGARHNALEILETHGGSALSAKEVKKKIFEEYKTKHL